MPYLKDKFNDSKYIFPTLEFLRVKVLVLNRELNEKNIHTFLYVINFSILLFILNSCSPSSPDIMPPPKVSMLKYISPFVEQGTRAYAGAEGVGAVLVEWNDIDTLKHGKLYKKDFGGFYVYKTTELDSLGMPKNFQIIRTLRAASGYADTNIIDENVDIDKDFFYLVKGFSKSDNTIEGISSDTVKIRLLRRPILQNPKGDVSDSIIKFTFSGTTGFNTIQVYEVDPDERITPLQTMWQTEITLPLNNTTHTIVYNGINPLQKGKSYKWRVDRIALGDNAVGTSKWGIFNYK